MPPNLQKPLHHPHDKAYKVLLSNRPLFAELLHHFVPGDWVNQLSAENLIRVDKSYILSDYKEKEADLVYRAKLHGQEFYFYMVLEFQSRVDFQMPHRLLTYMTEIWRDIQHHTPASEKRRKSYRLPAIIPIVLYNGTASWTTVSSFREMLQGQQYFGEELLNFRYILIDVKRLDAKHLEDMQSLLGLIFLVEQNPGAVPFTNQLRKSSQMLKNLNPELFQLFKSWFKMMNPKETQQIGHILDEYQDPKGADQMISNLTKALRDEYYEMRRQGRTEGETEARLDIARNLLQEGMSVEQTARLAGLDITEVQRLENNLNS
ncbi:Rpn family recombination-promoting nuclease/putative transposase [Saccharibacillus sp. JS10]|uniref:Rpn family recombination-promoting nuclease/putative transposase n=1 Tax=Saccharibacillus sp. JS10 TaxID=2950552 RepID=UPI00210C20B9|nr:Rpn family recombination-promoting nuclease/putative transposase [Saccharibacillus sp. JS10]MCQ4088788.1 Rpn family recombination-promoting nuclease/putative transposase [Saccharibacillus sp. JS10]